MKLLTVKELSKIISIKESTLYAWASQALIPSFKLNGLLRFDLEEIKNWINNSKQKREKISAPQPKNLGRHEINRIIKTTIALEKNRRYNFPQRESQTDQTSERR